MPHSNTPYPSSNQFLAVRALALHTFGSRSFDAALRLLVATVTSIVPGTGAISEAMALARDRDLAQRLALFDARLAALEDQIGPLAVADAYLESDRGREHVITMLTVAARATGDQQRSATAHGYLSGCGLGRFDPDTVDLLDRTLAAVTEQHMRVFRWVVDSQLGKDLPERRREPLLLQTLSEATGISPAIAQKLVDDLVQNGLVSDCGINKYGGYWGVLRFALSSFGRAFALYIEDARMFQGSAPPNLESPIPPSPEQPPK